LFFFGVVTGLAKYAMLQKRRATFLS